MTQHTIKCMVKGCESDGNYAGTIGLPKDLEVELALCRDHHQLVTGGAPMRVWTEGEIGGEVPVYAGPIMEES